MKRPLVTLLCLLLLASTAPLAQASSVARCLSFTDPKGDEGPAPDASLDITAASLRTVGKNLVAKVTVVQQATHPLLAPDSRTDVDFVVSGQHVTMFYKNGVAREKEASAFYQQGIRLDNTVVTGDVTGEISGNTLTLSVKLKTLSDAILAKVVGARFSAISFLARANYLYQDANETWDTALPPAGLGYVGGAPCR